MRSIRIVALLITLLGVLALAPAAFGVTSVQINYRLGQMVAGVPLSGGPNIRVYLTDQFHWANAVERRVVNDCSPPPMPDGTPRPVPIVGYWFFHPQKLVTLACNGQPIVGVKGIIPRDYDIQSRRAIYSACRSFNREAHYQPKGELFHVPCTYRYWDTYDGTITRDVLSRACNGSRSHNRLKQVVYKSDRRMQRMWCDGSKYPPDPAK
jgi:hypothetical protein